MSEHHQHNEFLKHCLRYDDSSERHHMMEKLVRLQHETRIVRRATWLLIFVIVPSAGGLAWSGTLLQYFSPAAQRAAMNLLVALSLGSVVSFLAFLFFGMFLRKKLHHQREECRQLVKRVLEARLGSGHPK